MLAIEQSARKWHGHDAPPDQLPGKAVDRWTIVGKAGTRIAIVEESASTATIKLSTPGGVTAEYTDASGGKVEIKAAGTGADGGPLVVQAASATSTRLRNEPNAYNLITVADGKVEVEIHAWDGKQIFAAVQPLVADAVSPA